jgi:hypothetical protein
LAAETCFRQAAANAILMHLGAIFAGKKKKMKGRIAFPFPNRQRFHNSCLVSDLPTGSKKNTGLVRPIQLQQVGHTHR